MKRCFAMFLALVLVFASFGAVSVLAEEGIYISKNIHMNDCLIGSDTVIVNYSGNVVSCETYIDNILVSTDTSVNFAIDEHLDSYGTYTLKMFAYNSYGVCISDLVIFNYVENKGIDFYYSETEEIVPMLPGATANYHVVEPLKYTISAGVNHDGVIENKDYELVNDYATYSMQFWGASYTTDSYTGLPFQIYDIDLNGKTDGEVAFRYTGSVWASEAVALKVYNPTSENWDYINKFYGSDSVSATVDVATYNTNGKIRIMAIMDNAFNGSNSFVFASNAFDASKIDTVVDDYKNSNIGYFAFDQNSFENEQDYQSVLTSLQNGNVPYGAIPNANSSNSMPEGYNTKNWFGGIWNNGSGFNLVNLGENDYIMIHLGDDIETDKTYADWINIISELYDTRTPIIFCDGYFTNESKREKILSMVSDTLWSDVILLSSDREELFVQPESTEFKTVYAVNCGSENNGLLRVSVDGTKLTFGEYSLDGVDSATNKEISINFNNHTSSYELTTVSFSAYVLGEVTDNTLSSDTAICITAPNGYKTYHHVSYYNYPPIPDEDNSVIDLDADALEELVTYANSLDLSGYSEDSVAKFNEALAACEEWGITGLKYIDLKRAINNLNYDHNCDPELVEWNGDKYGHYKVCTCGLIMEKGDHTPGDWKVSKEPEVGVPGKEEQRCDSCEYVLDERDTEPKPAPDPKPDPEPEPEPDPNPDPDPKPEPIGLRGDINKNGTIDSRDYVTLKRAYFKTARLDEIGTLLADINNNGAIDSRDYVTLKRVYFKTAKISEDLMFVYPDAE